MGNTMCTYSKYLLLLLSSYIPFTHASSNITSLQDVTCQTMLELGVMSADAPVQCDRLRQVQFDYIDFKGVTHHNGIMIVMDAVAPYVATIFEALYQIKFPIHQARSMIDYEGDDQRSMNDNNSSAFNYRALVGGRALSLHAYGLAVDINPVQNPFIEFTHLGKATFSPSDGVNYANRMPFRLGKPQATGFAEQVTAIFADNGFLYWGGFWDTPIDYQHFQVSRHMATLMSELKSDDAKLFFSQYVDWYRSCKAFYPVAYSQHRVNDYVHYLQDNLATDSLVDLYKKSSQQLLSAIERPFVRSEICVSN